MAGSGANSGLGAGVPAFESSLSDFVQLMKPRVMSLVIFTALVGMVTAPGQIHPVLAAIALLAIAVGAGASGALNMWYEADIDAKMQRTAARPIPRGRITEDEALTFGIVLAAGSVLTLGVLVNWVAGALLALTIAFYVVIYTMWLKRRTPQNIVIGGAAGSFPPMIGWAVATGGIAPESVLMFLLIFMWTPPHFWALALFVKTDYHKAGVPMLTVTNGTRSTRRHILVYTILLMAVALGVAFTSIGGPLYLAVAAILNLMFLKYAVDIWRRDEAVAEADGYLSERKFFKLSLYYLFAHFTAIWAQAALASYNLAGW